MAVVFRAPTSGNLTTTASPVVTAPAGLTDGDVIVVAFGLNDVVTIGGAPTLNGFTDLGVVPNGAQGSGHVLCKVASGEGASWTFTNLWSAASIAAFGCVAYQDDAAGDASPDQFASNAPTSSTTPVSASITPSVDNCMILGVFVGDANSGTVGTPLGGATERVDLDNGGSGYVYIEELLQTTAAPVTMSATFSIAVAISAFTLSIKPAGGAPPPPTNDARIVIRKA